MELPGQITRFGLYGEAPRRIEPEFLHIESISSRSSLHEWTISPHSHPDIHQLLLLERGEGLLARDDARLRLEPVSLVSIPSGHVHAFRFDPGAEGWVLSIAVSLLNDARIAGVCTLSAGAGAGFGIARLPAGSRGADALAWLLGDLAGLVADGHAGHLSNPAAAALAHVLSRTEGLLLDARATPVPAGRQSALAGQFRRLLDLHFREHWSVGRYAAELGTTVPTLTRSCRDVLGQSPGEVILDRLLLEAMRDLTYSAATISRIADSLGFADPAYFARFFRKRSGMTAREFRTERAWLDSGLDSAHDSGQSSGLGR